MTPTATPLPAGSADALLAATAFDAAGLVPVIAQDLSSGGVRMFAWANREALRLTTETGLAHFWSRSRQSLWRKGESSGNALCVRDIRVDCDGDVLLYLVDADGPSCHTGRTSCFFRGIDREDVAGGLAEDEGPADPPAVVVARVADVIARRRRDRPDKSYVVSLLDAGWPKILGKILEEAGELVDALPEADPAHTAHEAADLLFHVLVGLDAAGVPVDDVFAQLRGRFGVSGITEKERRSQGATPETPARPATPPVTPPNVAPLYLAGPDAVVRKAAPPKPAARQLAKPKPPARKPATTSSKTIAHSTKAARKTDSKAGRKR